MLTEHDSTWVDVVDDVVWLDGGKQFTWVSERDGWNHVYVVSRDGKSVRLVTRGAVRRARDQGHRRQGRLALLRGLARQPDPEVPLPHPARRQGQARAASAPATSPAPTSTTASPELQVRHRDLLQPGQPAGHPAGSAAGQPGDPHPGRQRAAAGAAWPVSGAARSSGSRIPAEDGAKMPGVLLKPADFDSTRKYPLLFFVYGGPGHTRGRGPVGRLLPVAHDADPEGLPRGHRGQPRHAGAARPRLAQGDLRPARRAGDPRPGRRRPDADAAALRGPEPGGHLGLELRRLHEPQRRCSSTPTSTAPASPCRR